MPITITGGATLTGGANIGTGGSPSPSPGPTDPNFSSVSFMFNGDGTNGADNNTFVDGSSNGYTVTENSSVIQGSFSPYSMPSGRAYTGSDGGSTYYNNDFNNYLSVSAGNFITTTTNYTLEAWAYWETAGTGVIINGMTSGNADRFYLSHVSNTYFFGDGDTNIISANVGPPATNTWIHYAVVKNGSTTKLYIDGVEEASTTSSLGTYTIATWQIGSRPSVSAGFPGYLSDVRVVNGTAVYTSAFTPNTSPLTAITNTSLLIQGQNSAIFDYTGKNNIDTVGDAQLDTAVKKYGTGSVKFDGTGDYLDIPGSEDFNFGSGDFTIEFWLNINSNNVTQAITDPRSSDNDNVPLVWVQGANGVVYYYTGGANKIVGTTQLATGQWYHVALARNGSTTTLYLDGSSEGSFTDNLTYIQPTTLKIGQRYTGTAFNLDGYLDDFRITKGLARYTANFTPPTAEFPTS